MTEEKTAIKESRPMSANNPLRRQKNNKVKYNNPKNSLLSEKEREQYNKLAKKPKMFNLMNSPFKNEMKDCLIYEKPITAKNLFSEIKETKTKTRLPKIQSSTATVGNKRKMIKLGIIDANKGINNENINNIININNNQRNNLEINCGGITNKQNNNIIIFQETYKEKGKLNNIKKNPLYKNNKSNDKINININQKKKVKEIEDNKKGKKNEDIKNLNCNININTKKSINNNNKSIKNNEKKEIKMSKENNNKNNNYIEVNTKNSNENKNVKFNKEVSIINILKENDNYEIERNSISIYNEREDITKDKTNSINSINIENSSIEVKFISNININTNNQNENINENDENKYNNYDIKQIVKNSANSNKNLSEISEQINTNLSTSKIEPFQENILSNNNNNNKKTGESSSDKNCGLIQSLSNNIETDYYIHKILNNENLNIFLGEIIYESPRSVIYKGLDLNTGKILCIKRYIDKNYPEEFKREKELFELINEKKEEKSEINIIKYFGFKCEEQGNFIFLEHASGDNLKKIIKLYGGKLNENLIRIYTKQILKAFKYLHNELKVAHRDIKCSNILLDKNGIIKLIDFGCSGIIENQIKENEKNNKNKDRNKPFIGFKGSWPWCSPEVLNNLNYGTKCDIWSLGCSIIEMGGIEPWNNKINGYYQYIEIVGKSKEIPEIPNQFSNELKDFVLQCLEKDSDKRPDADFLLNHIFITNSNI